MLSRGNLSSIKPIRTRVISIKISKPIEKITDHLYLKSIEYLSRYNSFALIIIKNEITKLSNLL